MKKVKNMTMYFLGFISAFIICTYWKIDTNGKSKNEIQNDVNSNMMSMFFEASDGTYEKSNESKWPSYGYTLNTELSICQNGSSLSWQDQKIRVYATSSDKCYVYFDRIKEATDLSGNGYNGTFENGIEIKKDDEGNVGLYFDGIDDYVDIVDLPESIDWKSGFTIEFEAKWLQFKHYSRILDFGNGPGVDNILIGNTFSTSTLIPSIRYESSVYEKEIVDAINLNQKIKFKIEYIQSGNRYIENVYKNNDKIDNITYNTINFVRNITRTNNFLGKSNWSSDAYFYGYIYNLKITDSNGEPILMYDFTK